jgi:hypothetical protein
MRSTIDRTPMTAHGKTGPARSAFLAETVPGYRGHGHVLCDTNTDRARAWKRWDQIKLGYATNEYQTYREQVPRGEERAARDWMAREMGASRETRNSVFPTTPDPNGSCRSFKSRCRMWRVQLHGDVTREPLLEAWKHSLHALGNG